MRKLGEILIESGELSRDQLSSALERQSITGGRLGTNLVEMMLIDDIRLGDILSKQLGVPSVHPKVLQTIPREVLELIPTNMVEYYKVVPFKLEGQRLHLAMLDPSNVTLVDELSHRLGYIIRPYICSENTLYRALSVHYRIAPPLRRNLNITETSSDFVTHDMSGIISLDDQGQFTFVDRVEILGESTKKLFLDAPTKTAIIGYFLQFLGYCCDKVAFLAYDNDKNYLWRDAKSFQEGKRGVPCGEQVNRSRFWSRYLEQPGFFFTKIPQPPGELGWVEPFIDLANVRAVFLAPIEVSKKVIGIAVGGSTVALSLEEEQDNIRKLHLMANCAMKIQENRKIIESIT